MESQDIFEPIESAVTSAEIGDTVAHTVHSNTHCNALVENPFAWEDEADSEE